MRCAAPSTADAAAAVPPAFIASALATARAARAALATLATFFYLCCCHVGARARLKLAHAGDVDKLERRRYGAGPHAIPDLGQLLQGQQERRRPVGACGWLQR